MAERYPIAPLLERWRKRNPLHMQRGCGCSVGGECASTESFARRIGVSHSTMHRRITEGSIDEYDADQWACRIGALPQNVWPDWGRVLHEPIEEPA